MTDGVQEPESNASSPAEHSEPVADASISNESNVEVNAAHTVTGEAVTSALAAPVVTGNPGNANGAAQRRSPWESSAAAIRYVGQASTTDEVQVRTSDRVTVIALLICCIAEVLSLVYTPMASMRLAFIAISDIVLAVAVTMFLIYRLGILSSLGKRQALICWQLMMGCVFLGIFLCVNVAAGVALTVSNMYPAEVPQAENAP